jgi:hypothetical protein
MDSNLNHLQNQGLPPRILQRRFDFANYISHIIDIQQGLTGEETGNEPKSRAERGKG